MYGGRGYGDSKRRRVAARRPPGSFGFVSSVPKAVGYAPVVSQGYVRPRTSIARVVVPGVTRRAGFYGRYNQPGGDNEIKFFDTVMTPTISTTAAIPTGGQVALISQGTSQSQRIGRMCKIKSVQFHGTVDLNGGTTPSGDVVQMILVLDKQANGAAAAVTDVFTSTDIGAALVNMANSSRFVILLRKKMALQPFGVSTTGNAMKAITFYHRCNIPMEYSSTTGAITEIKSNNLFWILGSTYTSTCTLEGQTRVRFSDD